MQEINIYLAEFEVGIERAEEKRNDQVCLDDKAQTEGKRDQEQGADKFDLNFGGLLYHKLQ